VSSAGKRALHTRSLSQA